MARERSLLQYNVYNPRGLPEKKNAGPKARMDSYRILKRNGFDNLYDASSPSKVIHITRQLFAISSLKEGQVLLVQYPAIRKILLQYLSLFKVTKKIALVHDLKDLRKWKTNRWGGALQTKLPPFQRLTALLA